MHVSTICRLRAEHGFTRKKIQHVAKLTAAFMASVYMFSENMFICVDESGSDSIVQLREYGYALRGERAVCRRLHVHGKCVSAIAAISTEGLELTDGSVNGHIFFIWSEEV